MLEPVYNSMSASARFPKGIDLGRRSRLSLTLRNRRNARISTNPLILNDALYGSARHSLTMEAMQVSVQRISIHADGVHAVVIAVSRERYSERPRARLTVSLRLEEVAGESLKDRKDRIRTEALRYLDVD